MEIKIHSINFDDAWNENETKQNNPRDWSCALVLVLNACIHMKAAIDTK